MIEWIYFHFDSVAVDTLTWIQYYKFYCGQSSTLKGIKFFLRNEIVREYIVQILWITTEWKKSSRECGRSCMQYFYFMWAFEKFNFQWKIYINIINFEKGRKEKDEKCENSPIKVWILKIKKFNMNFNGKFCIVYKWKSIYPFIHSQPFHFVFIMIAYFGCDRKKIVQLFWQYDLLLLIYRNITILYALKKILQAEVNVHYFSHI